SSFDVLVSHLPSSPTRRSSDLCQLQGADHRSTADADAEVAIDSVTSDEGGDDLVAAWHGFGADRAGAKMRADLERMIRARSMHRDRKSTRLNSSHVEISYAVFC